MNSLILNRIQNLTAKNPTSIVLGVIKGGHPFINDLKGLDLTDCISLLFVEKAFQDDLSSSCLAHFDVVIWFEGGAQSLTNEQVSHLEALDFPELKRMIRQVCEFIDPKQMRLVALEEHFIRFVAEVRSAFDIPGPKHHDVEPFADKITMKKTATANNVQTAKYRIVTVKELRTDQIVLELEKTVSYPMFMKPTQGGGACGTAKIVNRKALTDFAAIQDDEVSFLAEEYVEGREIHILGFRQNNNVEFFPSALIRTPLTIFEFLDAGEPISIMDEQDENQKTKMFNFGQEVAKAFPALEGTLLFIQFLETRNHEFYLNEITCRAPGVTGSTNFYHDSGIQPEVIQIMGQVKPISLKDFMTPRPYFGMICYPTREAKNCELRDIPEEGLSSKLEPRWLVQAGQNLKKAACVLDLVLRLYVWNSDYDSLSRDIKYLRENYDPLKL